MLKFGDKISTFMNQIGAGDRIFIILSDKYLRSTFCMFELSEVWRRSSLQEHSFRDRVRLYALPDADIWTVEDRVDWGIHWKSRYDALDAKARLHGVAILGEDGRRGLDQMLKLYTQVADILGTLADTVQPLTFADLQRYGFEDTPTRKPEILDPNQ